MNYLYKYKKYFQKSGTGFNIFDNIPIVYSDTFEIIIQHLIIPIYCPERIEPFTTFKTLYNRQAWHLPDTIDLLTIENTPKTLDEIANNVIGAKISDEYRTLFISMYAVPFMGTGKSLKELYEINPEVMKEPLNQLIISKRIQHLGNYRSQLFIFNKAKSLKCFSAESRSKFDTDLDLLVKKCRLKYEEQEGVIALKWVEAVEKEPLFISK